MKASKLFGLLIVAAALVALAVWSSRKESAADRPKGARTGEPLLAALQDTAALNGVTELEFDSSSLTVRVVRAESGWMLPGRFGYAVKFDRVRAFLQSAADLKIGEAMGDDPDVLKRLDLPVPGAAWPTNATRIVLKKADGGIVTEFAAGKPRTGSAGFPDGRFLGVAGQAFLVADNLSSLPRTAVDWIDRDLVDVQSPDVREIVVAEPGGPTTRIFRAGEASDFTVEGLATNEVPNRDSISSLTSLLSYLSLEDVVDPQAKPETLGLDKPTTFTVRTFKGQVYTLKYGRGTTETNACHATLSVAFEPPALTEIPAGADEAARKKAEDARKEQAEAQAKLAKETSALNARLSKWTYRLPEYKFDGIKPGRANWVKPRDEAPKPEGQPGEQPLGNVMSLPPPPAQP